MSTAEIKKGTRVAGRYRVLRRLGSGGMATVFLAEDERLGREVALKRLRTAAAEESLRRFEREARIGAGLNHPNLVSIYDTIAEDGDALIVMEYVPGRPLSEEIGGRRLRGRRGLEVLRGLAEALDHAHSAGVVHRDVKPSNVIVRDDGVVKLTDLGIARVEDETQITREGQVVGTLPYMAPERFEGPGRGTPESDLYSLAALAFEMLSGRAPKPPTSGNGGDPQHFSRLREQWPEGPAPVIEVLERSLSDRPERRHPTAKALVDELEAALRRSEGAERSTRVLGGRVGAAPPRKRPTSLGAPGGSGRRPWALLAVLAVLGVLAIGGVALTSGGDDGGGDKSEKRAKASGAGSAGGAEPAAPAASAPVAQDPAPATGGDPSGGAALNAQGFELIQAGSYEEAIPILERAVASFPEDSGDINYAFALFNLGNALRLAGRPEEAIPILERRLEIPNQTATVQRELDLARREAGE